MTQKNKNKFIKHWRIYVPIVSLFIIAAGAFIVAQIDSQPSAAASFQAAYTVQRRDLSIEGFEITNQ